MQKRCAAEFIGTFLYIFLSESAAVNADTQGVVVNALGNGLTLAVLIWCFSGAHSPPCHPLPGSLTCKRAQKKAWKTILLLCFEVHKTRRGKPSYSFVLRCGRGQLAIRVKRQALKGGSGMRVRGSRLSGVDEIRSLRHTHTHIMAPVQHRPRRRASTRTRGRTLIMCSLARKLIKMSCRRERLGRQVQPCCVDWPPCLRPHGQDHVHVGGHLTVGRLHPWRPRPACGHPWI